MNGQSRGVATSTRPTYVCIVRSEPSNSKRLYTVTTYDDILQVSSKRVEQTGDVNEAMRLVTRFLAGSSTRP